MAFTKYADSRILAAATNGGRSYVSRLGRTAHRAQFDYEKRPGYLYVRSRAISSRANLNSDLFPADEIKASWQTFIGKPVFVNHANDDHRRARGVIIDAALHEDRNPNGTPDTWVEVLMEVDAIRFPKLAEAIINGNVDRTSMGVDVERSVCTKCGNVAYTPLDYCACIRYSKGQTFRKQTSTGYDDIVIAERCEGLAFFENSLLVEEPADPTAAVLGVEGEGMMPKVAKTAAPVSWEGHPEWSTGPNVKTCPIDGNQAVISMGTDPGPDPYTIWTLACGHSVAQADYRSGQLRIVPAPEQTPTFPSDIPGVQAPSLVSARRRVASRQVTAGVKCYLTAKMQYDSARPGTQLHQQYWSITWNTSPDPADWGGPERIEGSEWDPDTANALVAAHGVTVTTPWEWNQFGFYRATGDWDRSVIASLHHGYGETTAPPEVDTLRQQACPVCGTESQAFNGSVCSVCGYTTPPEIMQPPDTGLAQRVDLRQDQQESQGGDSDVTVDDDRAPLDTVGARRTPIQEVSPVLGVGMKPALRQMLALNVQVEEQDKLLRAVAAKSGVSLVPYQRRVADRVKRLAEVKPAAPAAPAAPAVNRRVRPQVRRADINNPAQPIPAPPSEAASETSQQAAAPAAKVDVAAPGGTPVNDTSSTTTSVTPGPNPLTDTSADVTQSVTAPVSGTETNTEGKVPVDVQVGTPTDEVAFPITSAIAEPRLYASLRLARLRMEAGIAPRQDDLALANAIARNRKLSNERISDEIATLSSVIKVQAARPAQPRNDRQAPARRTAARAVPSLAPTVASMGVSASSDLEEPLW